MKYIFYWICMALNCSTQVDTCIFLGSWSPAIIFGKKYGLTKKDIIAGMEKMGYPCRPFFYPLSSLPAFEQYVQERHYENTNMNAYDLSDRGINPPCAMNLTTEQIDEYSSALLQVVEEKF